MSEYKLSMKHACMFLIALASIPCLTKAGEMPKTSVVSVGLQKYVRSARGVQFSEDGRSVCAWWWPSPMGDVRKLRVEFVIFDMKGELISYSQATTNRLEALQKFPELKCADITQDVIADAAEWIVARDFSQAIRLVKTGNSDYVAEMWTLPIQKAPVWKQSLSECYGPKFIKPLLEPQDSMVVIATSGHNATILDRKTGEVKDSFAFGHIETDEEAVIRRKKFKIRIDDDDPSLRFSAMTYSQGLNNDEEYIALGAFFDKRVRILRLISPYSTVFEANTDVNPWKPFGGVWRVSRVAFMSDGKYLLADYEFGGSGTSKVFDPTEIFDTTTWKVVWRNDDTNISSITLSPDGRTMAFLRNNIIELQSFDPKMNQQGDTDSAKGRK